MTILELRDEVDRLLQELDGAVSIVDKAATLTQKRIFALLYGELGKFEQNDGRFVVGAPITRRFFDIEKKMNEIINKSFRPSITEYLGKYSTIDEINAGMQRSYNDLEVSTSKLSQARKAVNDQAQTALTTGINDAYIQPAKYILMQQVTVGSTIKDAQRILRNWDAGKMTDGKLASGRPTPNLQRYSTQIARDSIYGANAAVNDVIAKEYGLTHFIYVGDVIKDSRPLCRHLVGLNRKISLDEMPKIISAYPQGLYPNTDKENFLQVRGGYGCRHTAVPVKPN